MLNSLYSVTGEKRLLCHMYYLKCQVLSVKQSHCGEIYNTQCVLRIVRISFSFQQEDLTSLGRMVLALACNSVVGIQSQHLHSSLDIVAQNYSPDLKNLIM